ncbi:MAG: acetyl-CoA acetyltransferase [Acidimicrobiales bacterium]
MTTTDHLPVIVGAGQVTNRDGEPREPLDLLVDAATAALDDALVPAGHDLASLLAVDVVSWLYEDLAARVATRLGCATRRCGATGVGGDKPTRALAAVGRQAAAEGGVHLVVGGEAMRSVQKAVSSGAAAYWTPTPAGGAPPDPKDYVSPEAYRHGLTWPSTVYPLYEHGLRAALGQTRAEAQAWSAALWSRLSEVAAPQTGAWFHDPVGPERLLRIDDGNRMICDPYPKLMNALLGVDQAAAAVVTDVATARQLGVTDDRMVHLWAEAGANDSSDVLARVGYDRSPAMERTLDDAITAAGISGRGRDGFAAVELYSCFPCVPKLALRHLGWPPDAEISVTGGLTFFGGPGNAYMLCAAAAMLAALRSVDDDRPALLYGQGEFVTKHHALVVGRSARPGGALPPGDEEARQRLVDAEPSPPVTTAPDGTGQIETSTVEFDREGSPARAIAAGRLTDGRRFVAHDTDTDDLACLLDPEGEPVGRKVTVTGGRDQPNRFALA